MFVVYYDFDAVVFLWPFFILSFMNVGVVVVVVVAVVVLFVSVVVVVVVSVVGLCCFLSGDVD